MKQESGRSMVEMLGVMAIMGLITVAAVSAITYGLKQQKRSAVNDEVMQIVMGVRQMLGQYPDFSNISPDIFGAIGMSDKNPFGGTYSLAVNSADNTQFIVAINGLAKSDCEYFKTSAWADSVEYKTTDGKVGGATGTCEDETGQNTIEIIYGN